MSDHVSRNGKPPACRIGLYVCHCGTNISKMVDVVGLADEFGTRGQVVVARHYRFMCSEPGQELIIKDIREQKLDRVVVAACSPLMHELTFRKAVERGGINRYLFEMVNIREQVSWVTTDYSAATGKARRLINGGLARVARHEPLEMRRVPITKRVMIIGGGIAGIETALQLADAGIEVVLVEKEDSIGGHMAMFDKTFPTLDCAACILTPKMVAVGQHPNITLRTWTEVQEVGGYVGSFKVKLRKKSRYVDTNICNGCGACYEACPSRPLPGVRKLVLGHELGKQGPALHRDTPKAGKLVRAEVEHPDTV
ncbi:CoB--CoM heterodisulfide reductase iron-sulfur subunit A family protein [candidate division KSB1 bacterium]|nr:CoB--CoM heterodisulfide reductase iron-sulfur subunit A family protein [candidate division KSB1 bacterium]